MTWDNVQQLIRITAYMAGSYALGDAVAAEAEYQAAVGGLVNIAAFAWWLARQRGWVR